MTGISSSFFDAQVHHRQCIGAAGPPYLQILLPKLKLQQPPKHIPWQQRGRKLHE